MRKLILVVLLALALVGKCAQMRVHAQDDEYVVTVRIEQMVNADTQIDYYEVFINGNRGAFVISIDNDLEFAKWLQSHQRQRVSLALK